MDITMKRFSIKRFINELKVKPFVIALAIIVIGAALIIITETIANHKKRKENDKELEG